MSRNTQSSSHGPAHQHLPRKYGVYRVEENTWYCACRPPLIARIYTSNVPNDNFGQSFFRCPNWDDKVKGTCNMFLWMRDAEERAERLRAQWERSRGVRRAGGTASPSRQPGTPVTPPSSSAGRHSASTPVPTVPGRLGGHNRSNRRADPAAVVRNDSARTLANDEQALALSLGGLSITPVCSGSLA
ncbi:hypothetical protein BJ508DRAFT_331767 [Ascobolus immersus RN42]|uniref:GRF-type domain-containing protein n=1 Tax=Ascobolus immersus RN42 TaxID=1160509 RepID=A0A3N4I1I7_ASCIM|nr:hypothetical protein BJ508DRAFT_331767 [Ascobolus immersus RN42]